MKAAAIFLRWLERTLLALGLGLGIWCGAVLSEAHFVATMPVPDPSTVTAASVPTTTVLPAPTAPPGGSWVARLDAPSVWLSATVLEGSDDATLGRGGRTH